MCFDVGGLPQSSSQHHQQVWVRLFDLNFVFFSNIKNSKRSKEIVDALQKGVSASNFPSSEVNVALLITILENHATCAALFLDILAYGEDDHKFSALLSFGRCLKSAGCTDYDRLILHFIYNLHNAKTKSPNIYRQVVAHLALLSPTWIEHLNGMVGRVCSSAPTELEMCMHVRNVASQFLGEEFAALLSDNPEKAQKKILSLYRLSFSWTNFSKVAEKYADAIPKHFDALSKGGPNAKLICPISFITELGVPSLPGSMSCFYEHHVANSTPDSDRIAKRENVVCVQFVKDASGTFHRTIVEAASECVTAASVLRSYILRNSMPVCPEGAGPEFVELQERQESWQEPTPDSDLSSDDD